MAESTLVKQASMGSAGLSPEEIMQAGQALYLVQEAQELQKRLKAPELQPTLIEQFMATKVPFAATGLQVKSEQRKQLMEYQKSLAEHFASTGQIALLPAVYAPLKPEEIQALVQGHLKQRQGAFALNRQIASPFTDAQTAAIQPHEYGPAGPALFPPGNQGALSPAGVMLGQQALRPTGQEAAGRVDQALQNPDRAASMLLAVHAALGKDAADMLRQQLGTNLQQRKDQRMQPFMDSIQKEMQQESQAPRVAPVQSGTAGPSAQVMPPAVLSEQAPVAQTAKGQEARLQATLVKAQTMGVNPSLVSAILGNEGSGDQSISPKGAGGRFQIMPNTGKMYGASAEQLLDSTINEVVGLRYIRDLADPKKHPDIQGRPDLVMAAYFSGPGNVKDGHIVNPNKHDGTREKPGMTVAQYVANGMRRMQAFTAQGQSNVPGATQAQTPADPGMMVAGPGAPASPTAQSTPEEAAAYRRAQERQRFAAQRNATALGASAQAAPVTQSQAQPQAPIPQAQPQVPVVAQAPAQPSAQGGIPTAPGLPNLQPFSVKYSQGTTLGPEGIKSIDPSQAKQKSAEVYTDQAMHQDPRLIPYALAEAAKKGAVPTPARLEHYTKVYSMGAMMAALGDTAVQAIPEADERFAQALRIASASAPAGLFDPKAVEGLRDPVLQAQAIERMKQRQQLTPLADDVAQREAERAGVKAEQTKAGDVRGGVTGYDQAAKNTLFNVEKEESAKFYTSTRTGYAISGDTPMTEVRQMLNSGEAHKLSAKEYDDLTTIRKAAGALKPYFKLIEEVYGRNGAWYMLKPSERPGATVASLWNRLIQLKPSLVALSRETEAQGTQLANIMGSKGTQTEQDIGRALGAIPKGWGIPDTPEVAQRLIYDLIGSFDGMAAATIHARPSNDPDKQYLDPYIYRPRIIVPVLKRK